MKKFTSHKILLLLQRWWPYTPRLLLLACQFCCTVLYVDLMNYGVCWRCFFFQHLCNFFCFYDFFIIFFNNSQSLLNHSAICHEKSQGNKMKNSPDLDSSSKLLLTWTQLHKSLINKLADWRLKKKLDTAVNAEQIDFEY